MNTDLPDKESQLRPIAIKKAIRYLLTEAVGDFNAALKLGRQRRDNVISREELSIQIARRFSPPLDAKS